METNKRLTTKALNILFLTFFVSVLVFFIVGELVMPHENPTVDGTCKVYDADWVWITPDGAAKEVEVPGTYDVEKNERMRLETTLDSNQSETWFCMRASQQDMRVYVGEELRQEYSTKESRLFGKNSASAYVFFQIKSEDAGKTLAVELVSDSEYAGFINTVYVGEKQDIIDFLIRECLMVIGVSLYLLILSSLVVATGCILRIVYKRKVDIVYLGLGLLILSMSMTAESNIRQFFLPNMSIAAHTGFLLTILVPFPFSVYVSRLQKNRYITAYKVVTTFVAVDFIGTVALQAMNLVDLGDSIFVSYINILLMVVIMAVTICMDIVKGHIKEYGEVIFGLLAMLVVAVWETYITFVPSSKYNGGVGLSFGLIILLFTAVSKTAREMIYIEKEKQAAIMASQAKANFLANMSHEIRTPINTIIGMNEMILRENQDEVVKEYASNVDNASRLLLSLVNDVLDFSKIEAGKMDILESNYHVSKMLTDVINGIRMKAESKNLELHTVIDKNLPSVVKGDEIRIRQILNNLLSNAVKYTKEGSITLTAKARYEKDTFMLLMSVEDTGIGIKPEDIDKLFDSFQRLEEKKNRNIEGTGLGLNITRQLAELMGGTVDVTSEYQKGSCFTVTIPQKIIDGKPLGDLAQAYQRDTTAKDTEKTKLYAPTARILVVDDNRMNLAVVKALLKRTGIKLTFAHGGVECLELCRKDTYDLILMDHMMPDPDGIETLHLLRADDESLNRNVEVIVLTANAIAGMAEKYKEEGFTDYLTKPIVTDELEKMLAMYLPAEKLEKTDEIATGIGIFHIDRKLGMEYCGNDAGIYQEMVDEYYSQGKEYLPKLTQYYRENDWKNFRTIIHALKNTSLLIGAAAFSEKAKYLEHAASDANEAVLLAECEPFLEEYKTILGMLE